MPTSAALPGSRTPSPDADSTDSPATPDSSSPATPATSAPSAATPSSAASTSSPSPVPPASAARQPHEHGARRTLDRRTLAKGAAWAAPVVAVSSPAPAFASSPQHCVDASVSYPSTFESSQVIPIPVDATTTVYAKITAEAAALDHERRLHLAHWYSTEDYNLTYGHTGYESAHWNPEYDLHPTGGTGLILNQDTPDSDQSVTVAFFKDAAATTPVEVFDLHVPIDDFSAAKSFESLIPVVWKCYQDVVQLTGRTASGAPLLPRLASITSTEGDLAADVIVGDPLTGWYIHANDVRIGRSVIGGTLHTSFGATTGVHSYTVRYTSNRQAATSLWSGAQGIALGVFSFCA